MEDQINVSWRKSSYSGNGGGNCVEVADQATRVLVRDTQDRTGPVLSVHPRRMAQVRRGRQALVASDPRFGGSVDAVGPPLRLRVPLRCVRVLAGSPQMSLVGRSRLSVVKRL
jgi:hypothetical protein